MCVGCCCRVISKLLLSHTLPGLLNSLHMTLLKHMQLNQATAIHPSQGLSQRQSQLTALLAKSRYEVSQYLGTAAVDLMQHSITESRRREQSLLCAG